MPNLSSIESRRMFLLSSSAASLALLMPRGGIAQNAPQEIPDSRNPVFDPTPKDAFLKFNLDGSRRPFAGNTIICHLPQQSRFRDLTANLGEALRTSSFSQKLGLLPSSSYHMSIFTGANDQNRAAYGWPADVPIDVPIAECNLIISERLASFRMHTDFPLRVQVDREKTLGPQRVSSLRMKPTDDKESAKLRDLRNRLASEVFRFRTKDHDTYVLHVSLAYQMSPLSRDEERQNRAILERYVPLIIAAAPVLELGIPEFCTFEDMFRFEIRSLLQT